MGQCVWDAAALRTTIPVPDCACKSVVSLLPTFVSPCGSKARTDETPLFPVPTFPCRSVRGFLMVGSNRTPTSTTRLALLRCTANAGR